MKELHEATDVAGDGAGARAPGRCGLQRRRGAPAVGRPALDHHVRIDHDLVDDVHDRAVEDGYRKARPDPDLPRQDIDINLRYPASFTPEQVEVVQAWANYRHVFYVTVDPPGPGLGLIRPGRDRQRSGCREESTTGTRSRRDVAARLSDVGPDDRDRYRTCLSTATTAELITCQVDTVLQVDLRTDVVVDDDVTTKLIVASS